MNTISYISSAGWQSRFWLVILSLIFLVMGFSSVQAQDEGKNSITPFALIGDMPYNAKQEEEVHNLIEVLNKENLAFVVHDGDFWFDGIAWKDTTKGLPPCAEDTFNDRLKLTQSINHPFIITPGDNDWTDCYRAKGHEYDPLDRLTKLRKMFFKGDRSLGKRTMPLTRQSSEIKYAKFRENVSWTYGDVMFVTLHMVGSNNNLGRTPEMDAEYEERNAAVLAWMDEAFKLATKNGNKAIMLITQANPHFETTWTPKLQKRYMLDGLKIKPPKEKIKTGFDDFITALEKHTVAFGKPVVLVHGDTHTFRIDKPLLDPKTGRMIENFTRVETYGFPDTHWVKVNIDPDDPDVFVFRQRIVAENRTKH